MSHDNHHESPKRVYFGIPIAFALSFWFIVFLSLKACDGNHGACGSECSKECMEHCKAEGKACSEECEKAMKDDEKKEGVTEENSKGVPAAKEGSETKETAAPAGEEKKEEGHH